MLNITGKSMFYLATNILISLLSIKQAIYTKYSHQVFYLLRSYHIGKFEDPIFRDNENLIEYQRLSNIFYQVEILRYENTTEKCPFLCQSIHFQITLNDFKSHPTDTRKEKIDNTRRNFIKITKQLHTKLSNL